MKDKIFFVLCFGFIFGTFFRSFIFFDFYFILTLFFIASILFFLYCIFFQKFLYLIFAFFILSFSFGSFNFTFQDLKRSSILENEIGEKITLKGIIIDEAEIRINQQRLIVQVQNFKNKFSILLSVPLGEKFFYGDEISFSGILKKPNNFITEQGKEFDYLNYLKKDKILYLMTYPQIEILSTGNGFFLKDFLFKIKAKFLEKNSILISKPESTLLGGLILGERASFSATLQENFIKTGTIHIVALSGYNVTIIAEWIMKLFLFLPLSVSFYLAILAIFLFVLMTGAKATAVRAGLMAILMLIARATDRNYDVLRALILVAVLMILINPWVLFFDLSFQLSFLATIGVIFFTPKIKKYFLWLPNFFNLRDIINVTCAAYLFVLPFLLFKLGNLSIIALPANILILPFIPLVMLLGFGAIFLSFFSNIISWPISYLAFLILKYQLYIINTLADFSWSSITIFNFPLWLTVLIYFYFLLLLFGKNLKNFFINLFN